VEVAVATMAGEVTLQVTPRGWGTAAAAGATIGDVKSAYAEVHGVPRGAQRMYLSGEVMNAGGGGADGAENGAEADADGHAGEVPDSMLVSDIPKDGILFMVAASWQVRVDYGRSYKCGDPCSRSPGDEGYDDEMGEVQKQLDHERAFDKRPGEEGGFDPSSAFSCAGVVWREGGDPDPACSRWQDGFDWEDEALGMAAYSKWSKGEDGSEGRGEGAVAVVRDHAIDRAAGLEWADRCLCAVRTLCQSGVDGSSSSQELSIHPGVFGSLAREVGQDLKTSLKWGPNALECVQVVIEARMRELLRDANGIASVSGRPFVPEADESKASGGLQVLSKDIHLARRLRGERS
jgi:histone H3/H4